MTLPIKVHAVKAMVSPVVIYRCDSWTIKKAERWRINAFRLWLLEKTLESPLDCKEIKSVNPTGNQPWIFIGRTVAEAELQYFLSPDAKSQLIGKDWCWQRRKAKEGGAEDGMVRQHHQLNGHKFEQTSRSPGERNGNPLQHSCLGKSHGWRSLISYSPWGCKESDMIGN